jgi:membrane-bound lytic murein transglycosylase D
VDAIPESKRNAWRYHLVTADDTLATVARDYRVLPARLAEVNQLSPDSDLKGVDALVVPLAPEAQPSTRRVLYTVRRGDTLITIADRFGVSLTELRRWNNLTGTRVEPGRRLHVAEPAPERSHSSVTRRRAHASASRATSSGSKKAPAAARKGASTAAKKPSGAGN